MLKAVRGSPKVTASASSKKPDNSPLVTIALFCGVGLLVSLVAMMAGAQDAWYWRRYD
jgi:hypothetical protein